MGTATATHRITFHRDMDSSLAVAQRSHDALLGRYSGQRGLLVEVTGTGVDQGNGEHYITVRAAQNDVRVYVEDLVSSVPVTAEGVRVAAAKGYYRVTVNGHVADTGRALEGGWHRVTWSDGWDDMFKLAEEGHPRLRLHHGGPDSNGYTGLDVLV